MQSTAYVPKYPTSKMAKCYNISTIRGCSLQFMERKQHNCNPDITEKLGHFAIQNSFNFGAMIAHAIAS